MISYKGKNNVKHQFINGEDLWMTCPKSFIEEMKNLGATIAVPTHKDNVHFLWLFDDNSNHIKKYYMFKDLHDKKIGWFTVDKCLETLEVFEIYHQKAEKWVPCVRIHKEDQAVPSKENINKPTTSPKPTTNTSVKVEKVSEPWYRQPLVIILIMLFIIMNISMCNHLITERDGFGIETTIKSHGD